MSEFGHIEITIENVATDGTRTRTTRWACPSVEMGSTRDQRVQLRFAGEPVVVAGEPTKPGTGAFWTPLDTALAIDAAARHRAAEAEIDDLAHRPGLTLDDLPRLRREAAETPPFHTGGRVPKGTIIYRHATFPHRPRSADGRRTCPAAPPDPCATEGPRKTKPMREIPIGWIGLDTFAGRVQHAEWMLHGVNPGMILETRSPGELPKRERIVSVHAISGQPAAIQFVLANGSRYKTEPWRGREEMRLLYPDGSVWWASTPYPGETTMRADGGDPYVLSAEPSIVVGSIVRPRLTAYAGTRWRVDSIDGGRANITQIDQPPGSFRCEGVGWAMESLTPVATEAPRDVATDPRVGDRVTVGGWLRTVEAVEPGRILVYSGPRFYWRPEEWAFLCQMPGAVIERAEDRPPRDVARSPKVGDRITINEAGERTTYEVQGFPEEGIACWASADGRPIGPCVVSPARWKAACGEGSGAVIERAPE